VRKVQQQADRSGHQNSYRCDPRLTFNGLQGNPLSARAGAIADPAKVIDVIYRVAYLLGVLLIHIVGPVALAAAAVAITVTIAAGLLAAPGIALSLVLLSRSALTALILLAGLTSLSALLILGLVGTSGVV
jgi:hypothetical protein